MKRFIFLFAALLLLYGCAGNPDLEPASSAPSAVSAPESLPQSSTASSSSEEASSSEESSSEGSSSETVSIPEPVASSLPQTPAAASEMETAPIVPVVSEPEPASQAATQPVAEPVISEPEATEQAAPQTEAPKQEVKVVTGANFLDKVEKNIISKINKERAAQGLPELTYSEELRSAARIRSRELYKTDTFAHTRPNGDDWSTVIKEDIPIHFVSAGENLCMTEYSDPDCNNATSASFWFNEWKNSPTHYENMVRERFNSVGVGVYCVKKDGVTYAYATTIFAEL